MKIGVLGTGDVGRVLADGFIALGHDVMMGSRTAGNEKAATWATKAGSRASIGTFEDAAKYGELIALATNGNATVEILAQAGPGNFAGKLVWDAANPLDHSTGKPRLSIVGYDSLGERVQAALPEAHVVKCFNTVGNALMFKPDLAGGPPTMFIAGNDEQAKVRTTAMLKEWGWETADIGTIDGSRYLEAMCIAWVGHGIKSGQWTHAFKLLRK